MRKLKNEIGIDKETELWKQILGKKANKETESNFPDLRNPTTQQSLDLGSHVQPTEETQAAMVEFHGGGRARDGAQRWGQPWWSSAVRARRGWPSSERGPRVTGRG